MRLALILGVTMGLFFGSAGTPIVLAQERLPPAVAPAPGIGHFGSLFASPPPRDAFGNRLRQSRPTDLKMSPPFKSLQLDQSERRPADKPTVVCGLSLLRRTLR